MGMSLSGAKMARPSGLRSIMDDIAATTSAASGDKWLNLSIGNPALIPEVVTAWQDLVQRSASENFSAASCQYGPSRGAPETVSAIVSYFNSRYGWDIGPANVVVGPGSQMLCFIAASLFTGPSAGGIQRIVLPMTPDYTGYQGVSLTEDAIAGVGPRIDVLDERTFRYSFDLPSLRQQDDIGMLLLSSPCNPTGRSLEADELTALVEFAESRDVPLFVDHAYGEPFPRIAETRTPPVWHDNVINFFTLSKAGLPGERVAFAVGAPRFIDAMVSHLANSALHAPQLAQAAAARALREGTLDTMVSTSIVPFYRERRALAERLIGELFPDDVDWRLHAGTGGMFCWLWIDHDWFDDDALYRLLKKKRVFITPGRHFFVQPITDEHLRKHSRRCFRISLSGDEETLHEGLRRVAEALDELRSGSGA